ncbi:sigma-B regulation protein RsbU (phosphoserine phosphatase) [Ectothiorhodosinus mongolicus]|uniref:Sigma-B regulation protein RsbU (Phosphoserine phosphatase) n=1 Tax=Ectothiorhodosinus mongolicus TaxID=233100 RepID=A0A1R3VR98_9GAMM|nr:SpoIIE family protein phosphatase [Ectothiorhodosinus mongolicus]ULX57788.1 serine/threonine protein phosphatase [Ectothiorhodosinus mongolicus]SIT65652.1 sigma-B regulation protein RsbU (phosphoserine phosphatase) [Ectothiorhodosinus mongolicus]
MLARHSLATRLALVSLLTIATIFFISTGAVYTMIRGILLENAEAQSRELVRATANQILISLNEVAGVGQHMAIHLQIGAYQPDDLFPMLDETVRGSRIISGANVSYEPFAAFPDRQYFGPFSYQTPEGIARMNLGGRGYDTFTRDWYQIPALTGRPYWTEPFPSAVDSNRLIVVYSVPFFDAEGALQGVIALDVELRSLVSIVDDVEIFDTGYAFLLSPTGRLITYPHEEWVMRESIFSLAQTLELPALRELGRQMQRTREAFLPLPTGILDEGARLYYLRLPELEWSLGVVIPERELFASIQRVISAILIIGSAGFLLLLLAIILISRGITRPLKGLVSSAEEIARGNLDRALPTIKTQDEIGDLSRSFDDMRRSLKDYINDLTQTTAAKERIESELKIARNIQMSFLPKRLALEGRQLPVDLHAELLSAKAVGGDLYDFFPMDDGRRLFFAIGDVSDKGVPAALFMAVTKTLVKGFAEQSPNPGEMLYRVNNELCLNNDSGMFVTYLCGVLDLTTGEMEFANAGHNPPLIARANGQHEWLKLPPGLVLGAMDDIEFPVSKVQLGPGDALMLYTDGVTEASNPQQELYGEDALEKLYARIKNHSAKAQVDAVFKAVEAHANGAEQSDDITALVLRYRPQPKG